jgi:hypothetical protein
MIDNKKSKSGLLSILATPIILFGAGCQTQVLPYLSAPDRANLLRREVAQTSLCLDAHTSRDAGICLSRLGDNAKDLFPNILDLASGVTAAVGIDPSAGKYGGKQLHNPIVIKERNYSGESQKLGKALVIHPINWPITFSERLSNATSNLFGIVNNLFGLAFKPTYASPSGRSNWFGDSSSGNEKLDGAKLAYDGAWGVVRDPIRGALYVLGSDIIPESWQHGIDNMREWAGYNNGLRDERLEQLFSKNRDPNDKDGLRLVIGALPGAGIVADRAIYGTTSINNYSETVPLTIPHSIPAKEASSWTHWSWIRHTRGEEYKSPGIREGDEVFPTEPNFLAGLRGAYTALTSFLHLGRHSHSTGRNDGAGMGIKGGSTRGAGGN